MSHAGPEPWDAVRARLCTLLARREAVVSDTAAAWAAFARGAGWTRADVEALWEGLTEETLRRYARRSGDGSRTARDDVLAAMAALRDRIVRELPG